MSLVRRLFSPAGFLLVILCFTLPFLTVSCSSPAGSIGMDVSGINMTTGTDPTTKTTGLFAAAEAASGTAGTSTPTLTAESVSSTLTSVLAPSSLALIVVALLLSLVRRSRFWPAAAATAGLLGGAALVGAVISLRGDAIDAVVKAAQASPIPVTAEGVASTMHLRYGFWLALSLLAVTIVGLVVDVLVRPRAKAGPLAAGPQAPLQQETVAPPAPVPAAPLPAPALVAD